MPLTYLFTYLLQLLSLKHRMVSYGMEWCGVVWCDLLKKDLALLIRISFTYKKPLQRLDTF
jgi:hypothetical protein